MTLEVGEDYAIRIDRIGPEHFAALTARNYAGWVVLADEHTAAACLPKLEPYLKDGPPTERIVIPAGERHKHLDTCRFIWDKLFAAGAGRNWCCLNLGGGVVGDMGGFAAATFKRGMDFIQIPTTLLSQVDASVGGKLGIDYHGVKNSIGTFQNPRAVWVDPGFLETLPPRELRSGFAEVIKHAVISDASAWKTLSRVDDLSQLDWPAVIAESVDIKRRIVVADPLEKGARKALNFGHTVGHAVESYFLETPHPLLHGEAIAIGMICEGWISAQDGMLQEAEYQCFRDFILRVYGHRPVPPASFDRLVELMRQDKKNEGSDINFTLLTGLGSHRVNATATPEVIRASLLAYNRSGAAEN